MNRDNITMLGFNLKYTTAIITVKIELTKKEINEVREPVKIKE
jgi:hypothetical protein